MAGERNSPGRVGCTDCSYSVFRKEFTRRRPDNVTVGASGHTWGVRLDGGPFLGVAGDRGNRVRGTPGLTKQRGVLTSRKHKDDREYK